MLSFYEFNCLLDAKKGNISETAIDDLMAKLKARKAQKGTAVVEPVTNVPQAEPTASPVNVDDMAAKIAALKQAQGAFADKASQPAAAKPAASATAAPVTKPAATGNRDINDPTAGKKYRVGVNRPAGEKNISNQMSPVATGNKDQARAALGMDDVAEFNQILMSGGGVEGGGEKFRHYAREALRAMGVEAPEGAFQIVPKAEGRPGEVVIPDLKKIKQVISSTWKSISPDYDVKGNRIAKEEMPPRMADFHSKIAAGLFNGFSTPVVHRAYQFFSTLKNPTLWGKMTTIDQLVAKLGQLPNKGGLQVPSPEDNRAAVDLLIKTDMSGKYRMFEIEGDPKDGKSKIIINGFPGGSDDEQDKLNTPVAAIPGKPDPGVSMGDLPGRSNKRALRNKLPGDLSGANKLRLALGLDPEKQKESVSQPKGTTIKEANDWMDLYCLMEEQGV